MRPVAQMLLMSLAFLSAEVAIGGEPEEIVNLAFPAERKPGWQLDAEASVSQLTMSWEDSGGQEYRAPIKFHNYPNGTFGAVLEILATANAVQCPPRFVPLSGIQKRLPFKGTIELVPDSLDSYKGTYSLVDPKGNPTQTLEVGPVGKNSEQLAFVSGTLHLVFPGGTPDAGIRMIPNAPGTRLILRPGVIAGGKQLAKGSFVLDLVLRDVAVKDQSGTERTIRNVLVYKVRMEGNQSAEIVTISDENGGKEEKPQTPHPRAAPPPPAESNFLSVTPASDVGIKGPRD